MKIDSTKPLDSTIVNIATDSYMRTYDPNYYLNNIENYKWYEQIKWYKFMPWNASYSPITQIEEATKLEEAYMVFNKPSLKKLNTETNQFEDVDIKNY